MWIDLLSSRQNNLWLFIMNVLYFPFWVALNTNILLFFSVGSLYYYDVTCSYSFIDSLYFFMNLSKRFRVFGKNYCASYWEINSGSSLMVLFCYSIQGATITSEDSVLCLNGIFLSPKLESLLSVSCFLLELLQIIAWLRLFLPLLWS